MDEIKITNKIYYHIRLINIVDIWKLRFFGENNKRKYKETFSV